MSCTAKKSWWDLINRPFAIWLLGLIVAGLVPFGYAKYSDHLRTAVEIRSIAYAIETRLVTIEPLLSEVLEAGHMDDNRRYRISNSFTGKMEQPVDDFGEIGVPGLLFRYAAVSGNHEAANIANKYAALMVPLERENLYARGGGFAGVALSTEGRALLQEFDQLMKQARKIVSR